MLPVITMVLWCGCLAVGIAGIVLARARLKRAAPPMPVETELLNVEAVSPQMDEPSAPRTPQAQTAMAPPPDLPAVAPPSPAIAFAQPLKQPQFKPIPKPVAAATKPIIVATTKPAAAPPANPGIVRLTFGEGEGDQPPPEEPPEAVRDGEEGTVVVRMTVDEDGRVTNAEAVSPCQWPLLNNAAVRAIRSTWRFRRGPVRIYEVPIEFDINRQ